ncbi:MAG: hypothetical protein AUH43_09900 [Acidobacteria bacterium 13_1_40CM_65_14]|nr:MAG: hypothetical protein AUH43_09900 [Acidobacteria bacterium 13_1_40CM_65_14]
MRRLSVTAVVLVLAIVGTAAQPQRTARADSAEAATAKRFAAIRNDPLALLAFLREMPKGGDLHNHLSGAVYAEKFLRWGADDKLCLATTAIAIVACDGKTPQVPLADVMENQSTYSALYNQAIDALSMRHWPETVNGHDHFFQAFAKFGSTSSKTGEMLADVTSRAAAERVSYLELMLTPAGTAAFAASQNVAWDATIPLTQLLPQVRDRIMDGGKFSAAVKAEALDRLTKAEARRRDLLKCGTPAEDAGCGVTVRYIAQVGRGGALAQVFALMLAGFELASAATPVVSLNLVQAEDDPNALGNFRLHMSMLDFLHARYPTVPITLHAGELTEGLVPPDALRFHIRESVVNGHAARIGHGVDIFNEDDPFALLRDMAAKKVLVEIALSSNDHILGVKGKRHPLRMYLQHGVPVTLVTDDMGVARSSHTQEYLKAVEEQDLDYPTLKRMVRNSIEYAFADSATKARLKSDLESALTAFERLQSARAPKS